MREKSVKLIFFNTLREHSVYLEEELIRSLDELLD